MVEGVLPLWRRVTTGEAHFGRPMYPRDAAIKLLTAAFDNMFGDIPRPRRCSSGVT